MLNFVICINYILLYDCMTDFQSTYEANYKLFIYNHHRNFIHFYFISKYMPMTVDSNISIEMVHYQGTMTVALSHNRYH